MKQTQNKHIGEEVTSILDELINKKPTIWDNIYWWIRYGIWQWLEDRPRKTKFFFQRGWRGWADEDVWGFYCYLSKVILEGLEHLQENKHGYPATLDGMTGKYEYDMDRWDKILNEMIDGFRLVRECAKGDNLEIGFTYHSEEEKDRMNKHMQEKFPNWRLTTKEEEMTINRAFTLFSEYFFSLWD